MLAFLESKHGQVIADLESKAAIDDELEGRIKAALDEFKGQFAA